MSATTSYSFKQDDKNRWLLFVNYSNNRTFLNGIPIPGFAWTYTPDPSLRLTLGIPFAFVFWKFTDRMTLSAFALGPWVIRTAVSYSIAGPLQAFVGYESGPEVFLEAGRSDAKERVFVDEKRGFLGARAPVARGLMAEIEAGLAFDRSVFRAHRYRDSARTTDEFSASPYAKLSINVSF